MRLKTGDGEVIGKLNSKSLLDLVTELLELNDDNLSARVLFDDDVQYCLGKLYDILKIMDE